MSRGLIFLANMKCASTSVSQALRAHCEITPQSAGTITHKPLSGVLDYLDSAGHDWSTLTSFATIRNPWARVLSFYEHLVAEPSLNPFWRGAADMANDFHDFIGMPLVQERLADLTVDEFCHDGQRRVRVDFLFRQERLAEEVVPFLAERGITLEGLPQARTRGRGQPYRDRYTPDSRDAVAKIFATDIRIGNYAF